MSMIHQITSVAGRNKRKLRRGRGEASGRGKTSGRGSKGSGARQGKPIKQGHEGGQTPIWRRLPMRGFSNAPFEKVYQIVNVEDLSRFDEGATVDAVLLQSAGLVAHPRRPVKVLGNGEITRKLTVQADWFSKSALEKIARAGGTALNPKGQPFELPKPKKKFVKRVKGPKADTGKADAEAKAPDAAGQAKPAAAKPAEAQAQSEA